MNEQKKAERMTAQGVGSQSSMLLCSESKDIFRQDVVSGWDAAKRRKMQPILFFCCCFLFSFCFCRFMKKEEVK